MRPGLNLAISTIRAWNNIGFSPSIVAPPNASRTTIVFHNPGPIDIMVAPVVVISDAGTLLPFPQGVQQDWQYDWPYAPDRAAGPLARAYMRPVDSPPPPIGNVPLNPSPSQLGGCIQVFSSGGDCTISGNVTMAWQAFTVGTPNPDDGIVGPTVVATLPPIAPGLGQLWWDTVAGQLYVWVGLQWVSASCCGPGTITPQPPPLPPPAGGYPLTVIELQ